MLNYSVDKKNLIGKLNEGDGMERYLKSIETEFSNEKQKQSSYDVLNKCLRRHWKDHPKIEVVGIIEPAFNQYGCLTFQPDKNYIKKLKARLLQNVIQNELGMADFRFFEYVELKDDKSETID